MLVLTRRKDEGIFVSLDSEARECLEEILIKAHREDVIPLVRSEIKIIITEIQENGNQVKIGLEAPREFVIYRSELLLKSPRAKRTKHRMEEIAADETLCLWQRIITAVKLKN